jgi:hypothetical protein
VTAQFDDPAAIDALLDRVRRQRSG